MLDRLRIGDKDSLEDFDASLKERAISAPVKKSIKETVPFSNVTYDFSAINGEIYWEERTLEYVFEIIADTPEALEEKKARFCNWVMNVMDENIYDPYEPDWHYHGTFDDIDPNDDESVEKTTITVTFAVYPYKIANVPSVYGFVIPANAETVAAIINESSHRLTPTLTLDVGLTVKTDKKSYSVPPGEVTDDSFKLNAGATFLTLANPNDTPCTLSIEFCREVF